MSEGEEEEEEVLGVDDVDTLNSPKLLLGDSAVTELVILFTLNDRMEVEKVVEACTHPEQLEEAINKLLSVKFIGYDEEEEELYHLEDSPVGESLRGFCREMFSKHKEVTREGIGTGDGGQIDFMLVRETEDGRTIRIGGDNIAEDEYVHKPT